MRAASRRTCAFVLWLLAGASLSACSAEQPEPPPFGEGDGADDDASNGLASSDAAGPTTTVNSATSGGPTSGTTGGTSGGTPSGTSGGTTGSATTGTTTSNPLGGTQTGAVTTGGMGMGNTTGGGVTTGGVSTAAVTTGGPTTGGVSTTTGGGFTGGPTTGSPIGGGVSTTTGGGFTNGGANTTGGEPCTNVDPTGTDWDEATCDQWASETEECDADWMVDNNYCNESCGRCSSTAPFGGN